MRVLQNYGWIHKPSWQLFQEHASQARGFCVAIDRLIDWRGELEQRPGTRGQGYTSVLQCGQGLHFPKNDLSNSWLYRPPTFSYAFCTSASLDGLIFSKLDRLAAGSPIAASRSDTGSWHFFVLIFPLSEMKGNGLDGMHENNSKVISCTATKAV